MALAVDSLPTDLAAAHAMIIAKHEALLAAEARASAAESAAKHRALLIEKLKYTIAKLRHEKFGQSSERGAILEQLELALAELEEDAAQAEATAEIAAAEAKVAVRSFERRKRRAGRCPSICRASASFIRARRPARAAAGFCTRSART